MAADRIERRFSEEDILDLLHWLTLREAKLPINHPIAFSVRVSSTSFSVTTSWVEPSEPLPLARNSD